MAEWIASTYGLQEQSTLLGFLQTVIYSIISILIGCIIIFIIKRIIRHTSKINSRLNERRAKTINTVTTSLTKYFVFFIVFCHILTLWGVNINSILALGSVITVAIGLGAQNIIQDIISGVFILAEDQFGVGDIISIESCSGTVESIGIKNTVIRNADGNTYIIPNGQIKIITNMSKGFNRAVVYAEVAYEENIDRVLGVLKDEMQLIYKEGSVEGLLGIPQVLGIEEFGENGIKIKIIADSEINFNWQIERELRRYIKNRFDKEGINIPYPQRVVHIQKN